MGGLDCRCFWNHPRMRGEERGNRPSDEDPEGITPACAGKSSPAPRRPRPLGNHPRMRGEEWAGWIVGVFVFGITSACAGKRVLQKGAVAMIAESPPHARGRAPDFAWRISELGITPACAGKRCTRSRIPPAAWNHPRVRGEENVRVQTEILRAESPPRARGRVAGAEWAAHVRGITPACAGKRVMKMRPPRV